MVRKASVVIPVFNEKENIGRVLKKIPRGYEVIVVDDGSTDNTVEVIRTFGYEPIQLGRHFGKGYACIKGAEAAKSEFVVFMDGDGQHDPKDLEYFVKNLRNNDIVLGCRPFGLIPLHRRFSNYIANLVVNSVLNTDFRDVQCGFRAIRKSKFKNLNIGSKGYEFEIDMILKATKKKMRIAQIPISVSYNGVSLDGRRFKIGSRMPFAKSMGLFLYLLRIMIFHRFM